MNLSRLLRLYPPAWRARYGDEFREIVCSRRASLGVVIDIVAGAVDAWLQPQSIVAADHIQEKTMAATLMKRCAAGSNLSIREQRIGAAIMLGGPLALAAMYVYLAARYGGNDLVDAFGMLIVPASLTLALPLTGLRDASWRARLVVMAVVLSILTLASYIATLI
jgi:hypothetical protein